MMKKYFRTLQSVLDSRWGNFQYAGMPAAQKTDRVLQSSKLEDCIYRDLSRDDENLESIQQKAVPKLHSFPALSRDIFQSFYSLFPKRNDTEKLTAEAQKFNAKLLDHVTEDADYPAIKSICEGRELPAYEAASEFTARISAQMDDLLPELGGKDGTLKTLEKLQAARNQAQQKLTELLEQMRDSVQNPTLEQAVIDAANQAESKTQQAEAVAKMVDVTAAQNKAVIRQSVSAAVGAAAEKARAEAEKGKRVRGASTISQQTAKNVFLWPGKSYLRKGIEVYFTFLIEWIWGKERIMEVYLNSIEMGEGIYGAEAVAEAHFGKHAYQLTKSEAALIAATLPNPRKFNSAKPSPYMLKRQAKIISLMGKLIKVEMGYGAGQVDPGTGKVKKRKKWRASVIMTWDESLMPMR